MTDPVFLRTPDVLQPGTTPGTGTTPPATEEQMLELAREFESTLILQMLRQMQQSVLSEDDEESGFGAGPLGDTLHQEVARQLAQQGGFGLSEGLAQALGRQTGSSATGGVRSAPSLGPLPSRASDSVGTPTATRLATPDSAVPLPIGASVTSQFGWRSDPFNGQSRFHGGVDIRAAQGDTVPAAKAGRVVFAGNQGGYGNTVVIEHEGGVRTRYAHLSGIEVEAEDVVSAGQLIGTVGQTGRATGPHLHFEVLQEGQRLDPMLAARRFSEALKKVQQVADLDDGESRSDSEIALE